MQNVHDSRSVANYLLGKAFKDNRSFTPMQLLKLVYLCHGWTLGFSGNPLLRDNVQAWQYGPVIPGLYQAVRQYRASPITEMLAHTPGPAFSANEQDVMDEVYRVYGGWSGPQLSTITHEPGTPWSDTWDSSLDRVIPNDLIRQHYQEKAAAN